MNDSLFGMNPFFIEQWNKGKVPCLGKDPSSIILDIARVPSYRWRQGYRIGVWLVPLDPHGWFTNIVTLTKGDIATIKFESRVEGETPRKSQPYISAMVSDLPPAQSVYAVLYARELLAEKDEPRTEHRLQLITVLANPTKEEVPMNPETLIANHFGWDGGTNTKMSPLEFERALKASTEYWRDKALLRIT